MPVVAGNQSIREIAKISLRVMSLLVLFSSPALLFCRQLFGKTKNERLGPSSIGTNIYDRVSDTTSHEKALARYKLKCLTGPGEK